MTLRAPQPGLALILVRILVVGLLPALGLVSACSVGSTPDAGSSPDMGSVCTYDPAPTVATRPATPPAAVSAGVAEAPIDLPVGTPMGGYSDRMKLLGGINLDGRPGAPFANLFVPSVGKQSLPLVRALYLKAGDEPLLLLKMDACVSYDRLVYDLEAALSAPNLLGDRARGHVIVSASHTHSGPATYQGVFHLYLGFDEFEESQYQRLLAALLRAGKQAIAAAAPARIGMGVWESWDPDDQIFSDRRSEDDILKDEEGHTGPHKDDRLTVIRVDDAAQNPLAVLFNFPMHGTVADYDNPLFSVDSTGHVELALEERFATPVLAMHLQGPAGDASPRGPDGIASCDTTQQLCSDYARMESLGELAAPKIYGLWQKVQTTGTLDMEMATRAVFNGRDIQVRGGALRYAPYQADVPVDGSAAAIYQPYTGHPATDPLRSPIPQFNVAVGAGLCGSTQSQLPVAGIIGTGGVAPYGSCSDIGAALHFVAELANLPDPPVPECETTRTTLGALRLSGMPVLRRQADGSEAGDQEDVMILTLPGEPLSLISEQLRTAAPFGKDRTFVVGYAQGHTGYILEPENWVLGGYEPSINIYGPIEGQWLIERSLELAQIAATPQREDPDSGRDRLHFQPAPLVKVVPAISAHAGTVPAALPLKDPGQPAAGPFPIFTRVFGELQQPQPAAVVPRGWGRATFVFYGGAPAEDFPTVTLEQETAAGQWQPAQHQSGRPVSSRGKELLLTYTPLPLDVPAQRVQDHLWTVEWQAVGWDVDAASVGLPGALRAPLGNYRFAVVGRSGGQPYSLQSDPFQVTAAGVIAVTLGRSGGTLSGQATYPVGPGYRMLRLTGPSNGTVPVSGTLTLRLTARGTTVQVTATADANGGFTVTPAGLDLSQGATAVVLDADGNSGSASTP